MGNLVDNKFSWVIKNFSSLQSKYVISDSFLLGGCQWSLVALPKVVGNNPDYFILCLELMEYKSLPLGWRGHARCLLTIVNQNSDKSFHHKEAKELFEQDVTDWFSSATLPFTTLEAKDGGFLVNDELKVVVEIDISEEAEETARSSKKIKLENGSAASGDLITEPSSVDINGFQVLPSQVELVRRIFEKQPDIAVGFRSKNSLMRKACMNTLLCLIETLCQSPQDLSGEDLVEANIALTYVKDAGFKVDWLEKKLYQVVEKKKKVQESHTQMRKMEVDLQHFKWMFASTERQLEEEKAKVAAAGASLTLDDIMS